MELTKHEKDWIDKSVHAQYLFASEGDWIGQDNIRKALDALEDKHLLSCRGMILHKDLSKFKGQYAKFKPLAEQKIKEIERELDKRNIKY